MTTSRDGVLVTLEPGIAAVAERHGRAFTRLANLSTVGQSTVEV